MAGRRGRPFLDPERRLDQRVNIRLTSRDYDTIYRRAAAERVSMAEFFRRQQLRREAPTDRKP